MKFYIDHPNECVLLLRISHRNNILLNDSILLISNIADHNWLCVVEYHILIK